MGRPSKEVKEKKVEIWMPKDTEKEQRRFDFLCGLASDLVIQQCKAKGTALDDHAERAYETAQKLTGLIFDEPKS